MLERVSPIVNLCDSQGILEGRFKEVFCFQEALRRVLWMINLVGCLMLNVCAFDQE